MRSPFHGRILKADETRTDSRCISLTSVYHAMERGGLFIARMKKNEVVEYGPLWNVTNEATLKRTVEVLVGYFDFIRSEAADLWSKGSGEGGGLAMNDGVTVCINGLRSIFHHLENVKRVSLSRLDDHEIVQAVEPWARLVGRHFASLSLEQMTQFRALRGVQGQTAGTRRVEEASHKVDLSFDPPGLKEFVEREKAQTTGRAYEEIKAIEQILQATVLSELKSEFGPKEEDWWFSGVPKDVRKKVDDRINEEAGKSGGREQNFDLIDYRNIIRANWQLFEDTLAEGAINWPLATRPP
jgi:DNA sulfur modification protein DndB